MVCCGERKLESDVIMFQQDIQVQMLFSTCLYDDD